LAMFIKLLEAVGKDVFYYFEGQWS
jgi:hypothetical protein